MWLKSSLTFLLRSEDSSAEININVYLLEPGNVPLEDFCKQYMRGQGLCKYSNIIGVFCA